MLLSIAATRSCAVARPVPCSRTLRRGNTTHVSTGSQPRILITGALGQIGSELTVRLRRMYGVDNVIASDVRKASAKFVSQGPYVYGDITNRRSMEQIIVEQNIDWIVHNSSILSAVGEKNPELAFSVNIDGVNVMLQLAQRHGLRILIPSSISSFGPTTPRHSTPNLTIQRPTTIYGVSKVYAELLGEYYNHRFGVDFRSLRYPGIMSSETLPGGGTTDYAVEIFYAALTRGEYECFLSEDTELPMMYMPDCLDATISLLGAPKEWLESRTFNVHGFSLTPRRLVEELRKYLPELRVSYAPDFRQSIADSWVCSMDDSEARKQWNWAPKWSLESTVLDMLQKLSTRLTPSQAHKFKRPAAESS